MSSSTSLRDPEFDLSSDLGNANESEQQRQFEMVARPVVDTFRGALYETKLITRGDLDTYERDMRNEALWLLHGKSDLASRIDTLKESRDIWIPQMIEEAKMAERKFLHDLEDAERNGWISKYSAEGWKERLENPTIPHWKKTEFIEKKFPTYYKNWEKLGADMEDMEEQRVALKLGTDALPELKLVYASGFSGLHFLLKRDLVNKAEASLAAYAKGEYNDKGLGGLYQQAKDQLEAAVEMGALSEWKVGEWLKRIFVKNARREKIRNFIEGKGETTLWRIIERWSAVRKRFDWIEQKRQEKGSPRGFHFVHINVFLGWHYEKRKAYVQEADNRFTAIENERESFLKIRHALDVKDWDEADALIADAKREELSVADQTKLQSMEKFLREHRKTPPKNEQTGESSPEELLMKMRGLIDQAPESLQSLYTETMRRGYNKFWTFCTLLYNRDWSDRHHYLTRRKELRLYEDSRMLTEERIKYGHGDHFEAQDVTSGRNNQNPAIRDQSGVNAAQVLFCDSSSKERILNAIEEQGSDRQFWYWTSLVPIDVSMSRHRELTQPGGVNAQLKKMMKQLDKAGVRFTRSGPPDYKYQAKASLN